MTDSARALPYDYAVLGDGLVPINLAARVTVPTMILAARAMPDTAQALAAAMPNARFEAMKGSAHETSPAEIAERVTRFLDSQV
jgi:pimeloyl-ACP methyl ester carboxylesterase